MVESKKIEHKITDFVNIPSTLDDLEDILNVFKFKVFSFLSMWESEAKIQRQLVVFNTICLNILDTQDNQKDTMPCKWILYSFIKNLPDIDSGDWKKNKFAELFSESFPIWEKNLKMIIDALTLKQEVLKWIIDEINIWDVLEYNISCLDKHEQDRLLLSVYERIKKTGVKKDILYKEIAKFIWWFENLTKSQKNSWPKAYLRKIWTNVFKQGILNKLVSKILENKDLFKWIVDFETWEINNNYTNEESDSLVRKEGLLLIDELYSIDKQTSLEIKNSLFVKWLCIWDRGKKASKQKDFFNNILASVTKNGLLGSKISTYFPDLREPDNKQLKRLYLEDKPISEKILVRITRRIINSNKIGRYLLRFDDIEIKKEDIIYFYISNLSGIEQKDLLENLFTAISKFPNKYKDILKKDLLKIQSVIRNFIIVSSKEYDWNKMSHQIREVLNIDSSILQQELIELLSKRLIEEDDVLIEIIPFLKLERERVNVDYWLEEIDKLDWEESILNKPLRIIENKLATLELGKKLLREEEKILEESLEESKGEIKILKSERERLRLEKENLMTWYDVRINRLIWEKEELMAWYDEEIKTLKSKERALERSLKGFKKEADKFESERIESKIKEEALEKSLQKSKEENKQLSQDKSVTLKKVESQDQEIEELRRLLNESKKENEQLSQDKSAALKIVESQDQEIEELKETLIKSQEIIESLKLRIEEIKHKSKEDKKMVLKEQKDKLLETTKADFSVNKRVLISRIVQFKDDNDYLYASIKELKKELKRLSLIEKETSKNLEWLKELVESLLEELDDVREDAECLIEEELKDEIREKRLDLFTRFHKVSIDIDKEIEGIWELTQKEKDDIEEKELNKPKYVWRFRWKK